MHDTCSTNFGVDSLRRFPFKAWTHRHTMSQFSLLLKIRNLESNQSLNVLQLYKA